MITLTTGAPGDGKTLYTIAMIKALAEKENREVYYNGIADLKLPWIPFDNGEKWYECPPGAIIVIDEAQRIFRPRGTGSVVPKHVAEAETHRHRGHDVFLITQHPGLIDANLRKLCGRHFHCKRKFGTQNSTIHEWAQVQPTPDQNRKDSIRHDFHFPRSLYGVYKSAEVHTHKARIPMRFWMLILLPFVAVGLLYFGVSSFFHRAENPPIPGVAAAKAGGQAATLGMGQSASGRVMPMTVTEYLQERQPRLSGLAHTAPRYDEATQPVHVPYPAACIKQGSRCECYTDQATPLPVAYEVCGQIVKHGLYIDFELRRSAPVARPAEPVKVATAPESFPPAEQDTFSIPGYVEVRRDAAPAQERSGEGGEPGLPSADRTRPNVPLVGPFGPAPK